jgi:hypothetical protein
MGKNTETFKVFVDDNYHFMDESERYEKGEYESYEQALTVCKAIVDQSLSAKYIDGMSAKELYDNYKAFGADPFVVPTPDAKAQFSAWEYAKKRCSEICSK